MKVVYRHDITTIEHNMAEFKSGYDVSKILGISEADIGELIMKDQQIVECDEKLEEASSSYSYKKDSTAAIANFEKVSN